MNYFTVLQQHLMPEPDAQPARGEFAALPLSPEMRALADAEMHRAERIAEALVGAGRWVKGLFVPVAHPVKVNRLPAT